MTMTRHGFADVTANEEYRDAQGYDPAAPIVDYIVRDSSALNERVRAIKQRVNTHDLESDDPIAVTLLGTDRLMKLHIPKPRRDKRLPTESEIRSRYAVGGQRHKWSRNR